MAIGNRILKQVKAWDSTMTTHYIRDARGNVMATYKNTELKEQNIFGSSRIGQYHGTTEDGKLKLGLKRYELTNHLGNVMAVITDRINIISNEEMSSGGPPPGGGPNGGASPDDPNNGDDPFSTDSRIFADVVSIGDYYPFGLSMPGRLFSADAYRYGFNGKEKDDNGEWGSNTHSEDRSLGGGTFYDYGFRIYNPSIAKFLSVDPITREYPMLTPYQYASNRPIDGIDLDGLEGVWFMFGEASFVAGDFDNGRGVATIVQSGVAIDDAGETHFNIHTLINPVTEPENSGNYLGGFELGANYSIKRDKRASFLHAVDGFNIDPGILSKDFSTSYKGRIKLGVGLNFSENSIGLTLGPSVGFSINKTSSNITSSISISSKEADWINEVASVPAEHWRVDKSMITPWVKDGEQVGFKSFIQTRDVDGNIKDTGIEIFTKDKVIWFSEDYINDSRLIKQKVDYKEYYEENKLMINSYNQEPDEAWEDVKYKK